MPTKHPSGIEQRIVDKVMARRGRLHAFTSLDPVKTALVVIDLDLGTGRDDESRMAVIAQRVNGLSAMLRQRGGVVAWVTTPVTQATENFRAVFGDALTDRYEADARSGKSNTIWPELQVAAADLYAVKRGHSAFLPGKCDLHDRLQAVGIESVLIVGAVTNVCCEASARDAAELGYKVTMVSDALIGWSPEQDAATFATFFRCYGDIRPTDNALELINGS
jgi:nicotinamidase-related amidase